METSRMGGRYRGYSNLGGILGYVEIVDKKWKLL